MHTTPIFTRTHTSEPCRLPACFFQEALSVISDSTLTIGLGLPDSWIEISLESTGIYDRIDGRGWPCRQSRDTYLINNRPHTRAAAAAACRMPSFTCLAYLERSQGEIYRIESRHSRHNKLLHTRATVNPYSIAVYLSATLNKFNLHPMFISHVTHI